MHSRVIVVIHHLLVDHLIAIRVVVSVIVLVGGLNHFLWRHGSLTGGLTFERVPHVNMLMVYGLTFERVSHVHMLMVNNVMICWVNFPMFHRFYRPHVNRPRRLN